MWDFIKFFKDSSKREIRNIMFELCLLYQFVFQNVFLLIILQTYIYPLTLKVAFSVLWCEVKQALKSEQL